MSIAISMGFMQAFSRLPDSIQKRTLEFLVKFEANPQAPGFNYETINAHSYFCGLITTMKLMLGHQIEGVK